MDNGQLKIENGKRKTKNEKENERPFAYLLIANI